MNWINKYDDWRLQTLNYDFKRIFVLASVIYFISIMFDFCLTYITYRLDSDGFFNYEISFVIKNALGGDPLFGMLIVVLVMSPLIVVYGLNVYLVKRYGKQVNEMKICFFFIYCICFIHICCGLTNFFHLINLKV